jgi:hypothetical protein
VCGADTIATRSFALLIDRELHCSPFQISKMKLSWLTRIFRVSADLFPIAGSESIVFYKRCLNQSKYAEGYKELPAPERISKMAVQKKSALRFSFFFSLTSTRERNWFS